MPNFDQTGPQGQGKMTGRRLGPCANLVRGGFGGRFRGCYPGFGRGLGRYFGWNIPQTDEEYVEDLKAYQKALQEELEDVSMELTNQSK